MPGSASFRSDSGATNRGITNWSSESRVSRTSARSGPLRRNRRSLTSGYELIGRPLAYERVEGVWGNREVPPHETRRRGFDVGETWFPPRERAKGERRSYRKSTHE